MGESNLASKGLPKEEILCLNRGGQAFDLLEPLLQRLY